MSRVLSIDKHLVQHSAMSPPLPDVYAPGTRITVGSHQARVVKYLTSGGFAHIYSAEISPPDPSCPSNVACLKRVLVPDKASLNTLRAEVDAMKLLRNNRYVVSYIDSHAAKSPFQNGTYEVFLLMEYCAGGGLIDFMNTRLQDRLKEFEVLKIMSEISQGIAAMHALQPPLVHRDIKIENVLISKEGEFKVCDFGSVCGVIRPPKNQEEFTYVQHDIMKNTTAQYRSPEMIDLYRGQSINEKSDIWALGVLLYKLCYYTTPFEKGGEIAILHSRYQFPAYPQYSDRLKNLIGVMLREDPAQRPNICQVLEEVSRIQGVQCPLRNFYLVRAMQQQNSDLHPSVSQSQLPMTLAHPMIPSVDIHGGQAPLRPAKSFNSDGVLTARQPVIIPQGIQTMNSNVSTDPFLNLDKTKLLTPNIPKLPAGPELSYNNHIVKSQTFPSMAAGAFLRRSASPVLAGRGDISKIVTANQTSASPSTLYVDSGTQTYDETEKLSRSVSRPLSNRSISSASSGGSIEVQGTGGSIRRRLSHKLKKIITGERRSSSPIKSRQNTGDSVRSTFTSLRRGLSGSNFTSDTSNKRNSMDITGGMVGSNSYKFRVSSSDSIEEEVSLQRASRERHKRSESTTSIVSDFETYERDNGTEVEDYYRSHSPIKMSSNKDSKSSIQKRVQDLLQNSNESPKKESGQSYSKKFGGKDNGIERQTTNETLVSKGDYSNLSTPKVLSPAKRQSSVLVTPMKSQQSASKKKPVPPPKPAHLRPKKPPKPSHLKSGKFSTPKKEALASPESVISVDVDDLEEDFRRRFPSAL